MQTCPGVAQKPGNALHIVVPGMLHGAAGSAQRQAVMVPPD
jgi:hypothetical protein